MFFHKHILLLGISLLSLAAAARADFTDQSEADLLAKLSDPSTRFSEEKAAACERLAVVGTEAAVPVLAALLDDEKLSHYARYALEPIPSTKVDEAFVQALATLQGKHLIGVIQSIGNRGQAEAIGPLAAKLSDVDRQVAKAAAHSIARLGTPRAGDLLREHLSGEFAPACLLCSKQLAKSGRSDQALALLLQIRKLDGAPQHVRLAATLQAIVLQGSGGVRLLAESLASDDEKTFRMALRAARLIDGGAAARVAREIAPKASPAHTVLLITLLGDLADADSLPLVLQAIESDKEPIRIAALEAMAALGSAKHVPLLMDAAGDPSPPVAAAAQNTLMALRGDDVDRAVLALLQDPQRREMAIRLVGKRRIAAAVPKLVAMIDGPHQLAVVAALGETVSLPDLDILGSRLDSDNQQLRQAASQALHAACNRMPDRDATVQRLAAYLQDASEQTVLFIMDQLRQIGGPKALAIVANAAHSDQAANREYATRALGGWLDTTAAPVLLQLAQSEGASKYGIRGIRGYIRLARQFSMPLKQREAMCRTALQTATRQEDKQLVLQVLQRYPSLGMLKIAVEAAKDPALKDAARNTAQVVAGKIKGHAAEVQALLAQIGLESSG